jgi:Subtilase family
MARRRAWPASIAALAAPCALAVALSASGALAPSAALAAATPPGDGALSPRLAELAKPALRTAPPAEQAQALSLAAEGPGSLAREGNRVLVEVRFDQGAAAAVEDLRQAGAEVVNVSPQYQTVTVAAKPDQLRALNGVPRVAGAREVLTPITAESTCPSGAVVSEGVQQLHAGEARQAFEVDGSGVTVGILSDSFNQATEAIGGGSIATRESDDVANGDLPGLTNTCSGQRTPVNALDDSETEGEDEGRAMAQIVHDVAPGANLAFATAFSGETAFAENIERLAKPIPLGAGAKVIADDVSYFEEPFFQEGPVGVAVKNVTEGGVTYFSSAGNNNLINGSHDIASWEAPQFRDAGSCPSALANFEATEEVFLNASHCMDFNPGEEADTTFGITVGPGETLTADLQWAEAWEAVNTDLDVFLLGPGGDVVAAEGKDNPATGRPVEILGWENESGSATTVRLMINRFSGALPRLKVALLQNGGGVTSTEYESSLGGDIVGPTIFGHNGGESTLSVAAIRFNTTAAPESYSSRGPVTHYFGPVNGTTPAAALGSPQVLSKPDLTATDCGGTSFFVPTATPALFRFCGTSAAAPHAAGVAALMMQRDPFASPSEIRSALVNSATPIDTFGLDAVGAGLVDAVGALERIPKPDQAGGGSSAFFVTPEDTPSAPSTPEPAPSAKVAPNPPTTFFRKRPPKLILTRRRSVRWTFGFGSDQGAVTFLCKVDRGPFHRCNAWFVRRYSLGRHVLRVKARRNSDSATDSSPAAYKFRIAPMRAGRLTARGINHTHHRRHRRGRS